MERENSVGTVEADIYDRVRNLVLREIERLEKTTTALDKLECYQLFQLAKVYAILKDDLRADIKDDIL